MPSPVRYIIHPGWVTSASDGDLHYITASELMSLYQINPRDPSVYCVIDRHGGNLGIGETPGDIHLYPRFDGNYSLPVADRLKGGELKQELIKEFGAMPLKIRLIVLLAAVAGLFRPGIVYTSLLTGIAQKITSISAYGQQGIQAIAWIMQELTKLNSNEAGR